MEVNQKRYAIDYWVDIARICWAAVTNPSNYPRMPVLTWGPKYNLHALRGDVIAGLSVAVMLVPQSLAYAQVAEVPYQTGLFSSFMGVFIYILFGTSNEITNGPTAIMSLLVAANAGAASTPAEKATHLHNAVLLSLLGGILQVILGALKLGFIVDFISYPVIEGFTSAAAITIGMGQVKGILGLKSKVRRPFKECVSDTFKYIHETRKWDVTMGVLCIVILIGLRMLKDSKGNANTTASKIIWLLGTARNALIAVICGFIGYGLSKSGHEDSLKLIGHIQGGLPDFKPPSMHGAKDLMQAAVLVALIGFLESIAIAKAFARKKNYEVDPSQELVALGASNIFGSFVGAYPVTGSFSRTAVNFASGVVTPAAGALTGSIVLMALAFMTSLFAFIPKSALSAIIISAVIQMVHYKLVPKIGFVYPADLLPFTLCFFGTLFLGIEDGIMFAVALNVLMLLLRFAWPKTERLVYDSQSDRYVPEPDTGAASGQSSPDGITISRPNQDLVFPASLNTKKDLLTAVDGDKSQILVLDMIHIRHIDFTGCQGMSDLALDLRVRGVRLYMANVCSQVYLALDRNHFWTEFEASRHETVAAAVTSAQADMLENGGPGESDDPTQKLLGNVLTPSYGINT